VNRHLHRDESGVTLAEMLVTLAILGVILTMASQSAFGLFRATSTVEERNVAADQSRLAVAATSRALRAAAPRPTTGGSTPPTFEVATTTQVRFYAALGSGTSAIDEEQRIVPVRVEYRVAGTQLLETVTDPVIDAAGEVTYPGAGRTRLVADHLRNPVGDPVFTYRRADGSALPLTPSAADMRAIRSVGLTLIASRDATPRTPPQEVRTEVRIINAHLSDEEDGS
jgi:prepilin-type N-terminal cleavage/methylation domain-containing protein